MPKKNATATPKTEVTYSDLFTMRRDLQRNIATAPDSIKPTLEAALAQIEEQIVPLAEAWKRSRYRTWHCLEPRDSARIQCHCGAPAVICDHGCFPGFYYYCDACAEVGPYDHVWHMISNEDSEQIMCDEPGCDEHADHCEWVPTEEGKGLSRHFCHYHLFGHHTT